MQRVVLNMQNYVLGEAVQMAMKSCGDFQVIVVEKPQEVVKKCYNFAANSVLMEVSRYATWQYEERIKLRDEIRKTCPNCKIVMMVDENSENEVAQKVKQAKRDGLIDQFIYGSTSASFLVALLDTL